MNIEFEATMWERERQNTAQKYNSLVSDTEAPR